MKSNRPNNLLFVFADQMRAHAMRCSGHPQVQTPAMDQLAREGVRCSNHIATHPVCGPNRGTLLTGTYAPTHRVVGNDLPVRTDLPSLGTVAQDHGCHTGYIGKWHLDGMPRNKFTPPGQRRLGFDYWAAYNCTHRYLQPRYFRDTPEEIRPGGYEPQVQTDLAIDYLRDRAAGSDPFCLVMSWGPPHDPYLELPESYLTRYDPATIELRPNAQPEADNLLARGMDCRRVTAAYHAAVTALDDQLARLLQALDDLQLAESTLVVFCSDHGDMLWSHGLMKKQLPYEESILVPLLLRCPRSLPAGRVCPTLIGTVDLLSTLSGLMGWTVPTSSQGRDLSSALRGGEIFDEPTSTYISNYINADEAIRQGVTGWRGVRTMQHTYAETAGRTPWLLFDNLADPYQMRNLVNSAETAGIQRTLAIELGQWLARTNDPGLDERQTLSHFGLLEAWDQRQTAMENWFKPPASKSQVP
jgi:arylsulfatase A-like enzyme